jgi:hypothetical protein
MKLFKTKNKNKLYNKNKSLSEIANFYEMDKGNCDKNKLSWGKDWPDHVCMGYTETYEKYMFQYREKKIKLFEIGICDKRFPFASPKMWLTYFKNINLYCIDNFWGNYLDERKKDIEMLNKLGVNFIYADQGSFCDWNEIKKHCPNDFDFFIEDGSHWPNHMAISLWQAKDILKSKAYYFMEDLQNPLTSRGKFRIDNSLLTEDLLNTLKNKKFNSHFLNDIQNKEVNENFELIDMILDKHSVIYLAVFQKK